jgi:hypothetical protein
VFKPSLKKRLNKHLEEIGVPTMWASSAREAIDYCDRGMPTLPVLTAAGPTQARVVIATLELQGFLRPEVDLSREPVLGNYPGPIAEQHDDRFDEAERQWHETFGGAELESEDSGTAMDHVAAAAQQEAVLQLEERSFLRAGYAWRVAEGQIAGWSESRDTPPAGFHESLLPMTPWGKRRAYYGAMRQLAEEMTVLWPNDRGRAIAACAATAVERKFPVAHASPGGSTGGADFLGRAFDVIEEHLSTNEPLSLDRTFRWIAFQYGLATFDAEQAVLSLNAEQA